MFSSMLSWHYYCNIMVYCCDIRLHDTNITCYQSYLITLSHDTFWIAVLHLFEVQRIPRWFLFLNSCVQFYCYGQFYWLSLLTLLLAQCICLCMHKQLLWFRDNSEKIATFHPDLPNTMQGKRWQCNSTKPWGHSLLHIMKTKTVSVVSTDGWGLPNASSLTSFLIWPLYHQRL